MTGAHAVPRTATGLLTTVAAVAREAARVLADAGFDEQQRMREVGLLARAWLGWDQARWLTDKDGPAPDGFAEGLMTWVGRRAQREPVAYILGIREFYGRPFQVTPDVLVPRPETEGLVDLALEWLRAHETGSGAPRHVLDVGTGSGCLAITLALEWSDATIVATDVSESALQVARQNAVAWGVSERITFMRESLAGAFDGVFDLIVANPPYVPESDRHLLQRDVRDFEPATALFGGLDGLEIIRALMPSAARALKPGGQLLVEIGIDQAPAVATLVFDAGLAWRDTRADLAGVPRVVVATKPEDARS